MTPNTTTIAKAIALLILGVVFMVTSLLSGMYFSLLWQTFFTYGYNLAH